MASATTSKEATSHNIKSKSKTLGDSLNRKLLGIWAAEGSENASFEITKDAFYYPEHSASYTYAILGDSLRIKYDDFDGNFSFKLRGDDILVISGDDGEHLFKRMN
ncbi:hypothetical protein [Hymenobacter sp. BT491]|uniref:hypothetical protein n=1 Tax=Hymenobacter sp. BT491 TaxID=2766779 RepID=UPI001653AB6E|nr:hypothetical protein [Hymenobacter sp. BT491]MBC6989841.1 hypothetical protein [Hymenobacter sp. BT491]